ncbi:hypothetical protein QAD02_000871 [Eretmocerus hayati]|uniref:Uncharacterized protein n=1 Tax=Eretmocerus hayati TaxID=131215 RepID=A0ACC2NH92_9HYME|nr:hypothetical protein QAD02_000871 [Eretmocerus hayati]
MSIIKKCLSCVPAAIKNATIIPRGYAGGRGLPVKWVMPQKPSCISKEKSGDGGLDFHIKEDDYLKGFEKSSELQDANELVKKMFTIAFNPRRELVNLRKRKSTEMVQRHSHDTLSMECRIARLTTKILSLQEHQEKHPTNRKTKVILKEAIEKRQMWLKKLRIQDYPRFEYLLERLNLTYHPAPEGSWKMLTIKDCTRRHLQKHCDEIIQKKLDDYRAELKSQQKDFFTEKAKKLEFIRNEEIACGVTPTVSEEEIAAAKQIVATFA